MRFIRQNLLPLAILFLLPIIILFPALMPGKVLLPAEMLGNQLPWKALLSPQASAPWNPLQFDGIAQFYPWRLFAANTLKSGYIPLWNPYQFCGTPFLANDQSAVLYPLNVLFLILPVTKAFGASAVLHLFLTGSFLYALLRRHVSMMPALLGAIIWQLSAWQISWLALPTFLCTSTWIPLALLQIERCVEKPVLGRGVALGAVLGVMLLAGHLQVAFYGLLISAAYGLTLMSGLHKPERKQLVVSFVGAAVVMLLVSAPQILPTVELARVSHRSGSHPDMAAYAGYIHLAMPPARLVTLFSPSFFGGSTDYWGGTLIPYPETACFVSIGGLLLMLMAITRLWKTSIHVRFFSIVALVSLLAALGTPLNLIPYFGIPGFGQSGSPGRILVLWTLSSSLLGGLGLQALLDDRCPKAAIWWTTGIALATFIGAILWIQGINPQLLNNIDLREVSISVGLLLVTLVVVVISHSGSIPVKTGSAIIVILCAADLMRAGFGYNPAANEAQVYPVMPAIAWLQAHAQGARIAVVNAPNAVYEGPALLPPNAATVYGLRDMQGYDSLQTKQMKEFINQANGNVESSPQENGNMALTHADAPLSAQAQLAGVQFIASPVALANAGVPLAQDAGMSVYGEPGNSVPRIRVEAPNRAISAADVLSDLPTRITARMPTGGDFVVADQWYPGWSASINGKAATVEKTDGVFRTVRNAGAGSQVDEDYQPASFGIGLYLLALALLLFGVQGGLALRRATIKTR